jgi:hypothetical protein
MGAFRIPVGSIWFWLIWRLVTLFILFLAPFVAFGQPQFSVVVRLIFVGTIYAVIIVSNEEFAYGYAGEDGIHYRRYFLLRFSAWGEIRSIRWSRPNQVSFILRNGFFRRTVYMQTSAGQSSAEPPEVVRWFLLAKPDGADGILLEGPGI